MPITISSWNIKDSFSNPEQRLLVAEHAVRSNPDIMFFHEAYVEGDQVAVEETTDYLTDKGYVVAAAPYGDNDGRADRHGLLTARHRRLEMDDRDLPEGSAIVNIGGRHGAQYHVFDGRRANGTMNIVGAHQDDRTTERRIMQAGVILSGNPDVVIGDLNDMHAGTMQARGLRLAHPLFKLLPEGTPGEDQSRLARIGSLGRRASNMAVGATIKMYETADLHDADRDLRPTMEMAGRALLQLDHAMVAPHISTALVVRPHFEGQPDHRQIVLRARRRDA